MILHLINKQGASQSYNVDNVKDAKSTIDTWHDPENLKARLIDKGIVIFEGEAIDLLQGDNT